MLFRTLHIEYLENRRLLSGQGWEVTSSHVIFGNDAVPRFAADAEFVAVKNGNWSDPRVWNLRKIPGDGATVQIPDGFELTYDLDSERELNAIEVSGHLKFASKVNTSLWVNEIMVMPTGVFTVGTLDAPISAQVKAQIVFTDTPGANGLHFKTGTLVNPGIDPEQWGNGLLVFGKAEMHGQVQKESFIRLLEEPQVGDQFLVLMEIPEGWRSGDELILPDTHADWSEDRIEELRIDSIDGNVIALAEPLRQDHRGSHLQDGTIDSLPHVANLSRNVIVRSENSEGVRGHTVFFAQAEVSLQYTQFKNLGRTSNQDIDNTQFDATANVTHIGFNQEGRYSVQLRQHSGPENPSNIGYQFQINGNSFERGLRRGISLHQSSYGKVDGNVFYDFDGAVLATESGNESYNELTNNFAVKTNGNGSFRDGLAGDAFWFRGFNNVINNNVAANSKRTGVSIYAQGLPTEISLPLFRGAHPNDLLEANVVKSNELSWLSFAGNEVYASLSAFEFRHNVPEQRQYIKDLLVWHTADNGFLVSSTATQNVVIDGLRAVGDFANLDSSRLQKYQPVPVTGIESNKQSNNLIIRDIEIRGAQTGIQTPNLQVEKMSIQDSTIQAYTGVLVKRMTAGETNATVPDLEYSSLTIENTRFLPMPTNAAQPKQYSIFMDYDSSFQIRTNLLAKNEVFVYDFNGVKGANFQIFYLEQAPNFVVPQSVLFDNSRNNFIASPEPGLTNQQLWDKYGVALGGAVAPSRRIDGDDGAAALARAKALGIRGLLFPLVDALPKPSVAAGTDRKVELEKPLLLTGEVSKGSKSNWSTLSGPRLAQFDDANDAHTTVHFTEPGTYVLRLTATIGGRYSHDDVIVNVTRYIPPPNLAPLVNAGNDQSLSRSNQTVLSGTVLDDGSPNNLVTTTWRQVKGPGTAIILNPMRPLTEVVFSSNGRYVLELVASDGEYISSDQIVVSVNLPSKPLIVGEVVRYNDWQTVVADMHGKNDNGRVEWDAEKRAARLNFEPGLGSISPQLRYAFNDGGASVLRVSIEAMHGTEWNDTNMPVHKSFQLAVAGQVGPDLRFEARHHYDGKTIISDIRAYLGIAKIGDLDRIDGWLRGPTIKLSVWNKYEWQLDYANNRFSYWINGTPVYDNVVVNYDFHINEFWVEFNSSLAIEHNVNAAIWVRNLKISADNLNNNSVVNLRPFDNNSAFDGNDENANAGDDLAIATDKAALIRGKSSPSNNLIYSRDIDGRMINAAGQLRPLNTIDFAFAIGNSDALDSWQSTPLTAQILVGAADRIGRSNRVDLIWDDNLIGNTWMQVTVRANANTEILSPDIFYFGTAIVEIGNSQSTTTFSSGLEIATDGIQLAGVELPNKFAVTSVQYSQLTSQPLLSEIVDEFMSKFNRLQILLQEKSRTIRVLKQRPSIEYEFDATDEQWLIVDTSNVEEAIR